jgi:hypothetical protein
MMHTTQQQTQSMIICWFAREGCFSNFQQLRRAGSISKCFGKFPKTALDIFHSTAKNSKWSFFATVCVVGGCWATRVIFRRISVAAHSRLVMFRSVPMRLVVHTGAAENAAVNGRLPCATGQKEEFSIARTGRRAMGTRNGIWFGMKQKVPDSPQGQPGEKC